MRPLRQTRGGWRSQCRLVIVDLPFANFTGGDADFRGITAMNFEFGVSKLTPAKTGDSLPARWFP